MEKMIIVLHNFRKCWNDTILNNITITEIDEFKNPKGDLKLLIVILLIYLKIKIK